jgi:hypothetical protein
MKQSDDTVVYRFFKGHTLSSLGINIEDELSVNIGDPDLVSVVIEGLRKGSNRDAQTEQVQFSEPDHIERISLPKEAPLSALWEKINCMYRNIFYSKNFVRERCTHDSQLWVMYVPMG